MIILMINYYYWCYWNSNPTPKSIKQSYSLVKRKHTIKTQGNYRTRNQKLLQQVFQVRKTWLCFI
ncbi:hypothetical protein [Spiroplasma poulsonii]|uniref:hypothetical protein n=1 Tax=Spiroplasma poulsonii TaxID=2138 RepID=UPI001F4C880A|nr:hypothetical protein [Spiroplasma poulsonii]UNF62569.1 hypothetical protein MNU24_03695 [Spiroplasma poulsonii]